MRDKESLEYQKRALALIKECQVPEEVAVKDFDKYGYQSMSLPATKTSAPYCYDIVKAKEREDEIREIISLLPQKKVGSFALLMIEDILSDKILNAAENKQVDNNLLKQIQVQGYITEAFFALAESIHYGVIHPDSPTLAFLLTERIKSKYKDESQSKTQNER